jgi:outer membrane lipoprotein-sorting protein
MTVKEVHMSVLTSRPALRWIVPTAATVVLIGGGAALGQFAAEAEPSLPPRSAAQLLVDLQTSRLEGLSGTVVQRANLGLPPLVATVAERSEDLTALIAGTHTMRVWYSGPDKARVAFKDTLGERDVIRNGTDLWVWSSKNNEAYHRTLPADAGQHPEEAADLPVTPAEAADRALAAIDPSTEVSVGRSATVAGRDAYELVLKPRDATSLVDQVRIALDAKEHVPLRFELFADEEDAPAIEVAFTQVDFSRPDADQFTFNPPPGVKVNEEKSTGARPERPEKPAGAKDREDVKVIGEGWAAVLVARTDDANPAGKPTGQDAPARQPEGSDAAAGLDLLNQLPKVSGDWGSGRLFSGTIFSVLLTDDGRVIAGLVTPERLYEVARG